MPNTFSWLFVPLLAHAVGQDQHPAFRYFPADQHPFNGWVAECAVALQLHGQTWQAVSNGRNYIDALRQEQLLDLLPLAVHQDIMTYGAARAQGACQQLEAMHVAHRYSYSVLLAGPCVL